MPEAFIDLSELKTDTLRDIVVASGVIWPDGDDRESRLFRFRIRRIAKPDDGKLAIGIAAQTNSWQRLGGGIQSPRVGPLTILIEPTQHDGRRIPRAGIKPGGIEAFAK